MEQKSKPHGAASLQLQAQASGWGGSKITDKKLLCIYMPFYDTRNRDSRETCMLETIDTLSMVKNILDDFPNHHVIIGGDLNTELKGASPFDPLWEDLMQRKNLKCSDESTQNKNTIDYTYHHETLNHKKWNDHFIVDSEFLAAMQNQRILDEGDNVSDHKPLIFEMNLTHTAPPE